jgi:hypothetical protein
MLNMAAGIYNITIEKRSSFSFSATIKESNGSPYDLSNRTLHGQIRRDWDNGLQADLNITETDAVNGVINVSLTKEQTAALTFDDSSYDIFADNDSTQESKKILVGSVKIVENKTEL